MALTIGIVGLPNVGKSTLFNALTKNDVLAANYPFATIEPNVGVVNLPDPRLDQLAEIFHSERIVPATVAFVDIAGIVKGASEGEGLGNQFLANIREADAIAQVVRGFDDSDVVHVAGAIDPASDLETITTELALADLQTLDKAIPRFEKEVKGKKLDPSVLAAALAAQTALNAGTPLSAAKDVDLHAIRELGLLTAKPIIYVFNVDEAVLTSDAKRAELAALVAAVEGGVPRREDRVGAHRPRPRRRRRAAGIDRPDRVGSQPARAHRLRHARAADLPDGRAQGITRLDDRQGLEGTAGGGGHPHRLRARLHQGRDRVVRRPRRDGIDRRGAREGQGPHRGQGLRDARRRRGGVPLPSNVRESEVAMTAGRIPAIVQAFFAAENERDWDSYTRFLHPDVEWTIVGEEGTQVVRGAKDYVDRMRSAYVGSAEHFRLVQALLSQGGSMSAYLLVDESGRRSLDILEWNGELLRREWEFPFGVGSDWNGDVVEFRFNT